MLSTHTAKTTLDTRNASCFQGGGDTALKSALQQAKLERAQAAADIAALHEALAKANTAAVESSGKQTIADLQEVTDVNTLRHCAHARACAKKLGCIAVYHAQPLVGLIVAYRCPTESMAAITSANRHRHSQTHTLSTATSTTR
jgi:hypothetical protein